MVGEPYEPERSTLFCDPPLRGGDPARLFHREPAVLALDLRFQSLSAGSDSNTIAEDIKSEYAIISPSHNVAEVLQRTVPLICIHTVGRWEVVFVLDQSYDDSLQVLRKILLSDQCLNKNKAAPNMMIRARVLVQPTSIFETSADNLGLSLAHPTHFYIELQSDMFINATGWNFDMARPILQYGDILAVGGRCGRDHPGSQVDGHYRLGRCGREVAKLNDAMQQQDENIVHIVGQTPRGPIIIRADALRQLGFFDEVNFHQGNDDRDLFRRALHHGWHAAYRYAEFYSPLDLSPMRNAEFNAKIPDLGKAQSHWYSVYRKELNNMTCDPNVPFDAFAVDLLPKGKAEDRPLKPMQPERSSDEKSPFILPPLPPLVDLLSKNK